MLNTHRWQLGRKYCEKCGSEEKILTETCSMHGNTKV
jgi:hypothetical protein